jgi:hypothetical protein
MIQAAYPPKMLHEILGHASITTTLDRSCSAVGRRRTSFIHAWPLASASST